ncbi:hypothetical protein Ae201684P_021527 [Aphanomyces euteiches]|nr:hypothetical protein Ae201684P_021527 [Aphanomyces euteiches]
MDADTSWDIMEDLGFLIATDEDLQADLAHVCDLLEETPSDSSALSRPASTETAVKTKKRQRVNHNKQEIRSLQKQVVALQEKLAHEKSRLKTTFSLSAWEQAARLEQVQAKRAIDENTELRAGIAEGTAFIQYMRSILQKKPRHLTMLSDPSSADWKEGSVDNMSGWMASTPSEVDRERSCHLTSVIHMPLESMEDSIVDRLVSTLASFSFTAAPTTLPQPCNVPHMQAFFDRAKIYHNAMMEAMQDAIAAFQKAN